METDASRTYILNEFPDILEEIFMFLSPRDLGRAAQVCRYWRSIAYWKSLWKCAVVSSARFTLEVLPNWVERGIRRVQFTSSNHLRVLLRSLVNVEYIHLDYPVSDADFSDFFTEIRNRDFTSLKTLKIRFAGSSPVGPMTRIFSFVPNLQELSMSKPCLFNPKGYQLSIEDIREMLRTLKQLRILTLSGYDCTRFQWSATALSLEYLCLNCGDPINDESLKTISFTFPNLRQFELFEHARSHVVAISNEGVMAAVRNLKKLRRLTLKGLPYINLHSVLKSCDGSGSRNCSDSLEQLIVSNCSKHFDDFSLETIIHSFPNLRHLQIIFRAEHSFTLANKTCFTDEGLIKLLSGLEKLSTLTIRDYPRKTFRSGSPMNLFVDTNGEVYDCPARIGTVHNLRQFQVSYSQSTKTRYLEYFGHDLPQCQDIIFTECSECNDFTKSLNSKKRSLRLI